MLDVAYEQYLKQPHATRVCHAFVEALRDANLHVESDCLFRWLKGEIQSEREFIGPLPPMTPRVGDYWFDTVAMTQAVYLFDEETENHFWLSTSPVRTWQYSGFLRTAAWKVIDDPFLSVNDVLKSSRIDRLQLTDPVTNLYNAEAFAYAQWFHKILCTEFDLIRGLSLKRSDLPANLRESALRLWDLMRPADDEENSRGVIRISDSPLELQMEALGEWETHSDIGLLTSTAGDSPMTPDEYGTRTEFVIFKTLLDRNQFERTSN
ncbi:hypothetical protein Enr10x_02440 [Gimesia panareensis]|uniref:Uncharacterized protein n=1 Tax=Gimesia panareensis TaxID=2527978 RepID=A0A517PZZ3_9PLAN|nr:hypothetical protein [Gimesia panareensis]QDT24950.1 hypothetical protein Enr10x_02440 [Gimesia panareensis]